VETVAFFSMRTYGVISCYFFLSRTCLGIWSRLGSRVNIPKLVAPALYCCISYFLVFKNYEIIHGHRLWCILYTQKVCVKNMTICDLCKKVKSQLNNTMCYLHIICYFCIGHKMLYFLMKLCSCTRYNIIYIHELFHII
jgi:hypothetical protein